MYTCTSLLVHVCVCVFYSLLQAELMSEEGWLTSVEQEALEYLKMLETYYPTDVYETAKMLYSSTSQSYQPPIAALSPVSTTGNILDMYPETFGGVSEERERKRIQREESGSCDGVRVKLIISNSHSRIILWYGYQSQPLYPLPMRHREDYT